ncbi:MAG: hypothetical protein ACP5HG_01670, partial [Anaerolineae bacterium]
SWLQFWHTRDMIGSLAMRAESFIKQDKERDMAQYTFAMAVGRRKAFRAMRSSEHTPDLKPPG